MNKTEASSIQLEILVSTMDRNSLDFLKMMFENNELSECQVLVINQTSESTLLHSDYPNIRTINSFEKGLSKSRNLAIENAIGDIVLIADDDVVFVTDLYNKVCNAFKTKPYATLISFMAKDLEGKLYRNYPQKSCEHTYGTIKDVISLEIAFDLKKIRELEVNFDEKFGLGA